MEEAEVSVEPENAAGPVPEEPAESPSGADPSVSRSLYFPALLFLMVFNGGGYSTHKTFSHRQGVPILKSQLF